MAIKKSDPYSSLWASCDELRGGMDASQYKDYVLFMLFIKYISDKYGNSDDFAPPVVIPPGASFKDMEALKGKADIGDKINTQIIQPLIDANSRLARSDFPDFNDPNKLGEGSAMVERLTNLVGIFQKPELDFSQNRAENDDILGDAYEYLMRHFATESGKSKGQFYTPSEVSRIIAKVIGIAPGSARASTTAYDPTCGSGSLLLKVAAQAGMHITLEGQEMDVTTAGLARMNMILHDFPTASIMTGNTLSDPKFKDGEQLRTYDYVVANPPFSVKTWSTGLTPANDPYQRFAWGEPPAKQGDYAFLLHLSQSLAQKEHPMPLHRPNIEQLRAIASSLHMHPTEPELAQYLALMEGSFSAYDRLDQLPDFLPAVNYPRTPGRRPSAEDNPMNAWYVKTDIRGAAAGPLTGKRVVLKDNIALAGVQMMNGASTLEGYVPEVDASVVARILDAGGTIVGKAHCEYFCLSGGSHTNATGPVHNPLRRGYIAGGSSSGCGALVGAGEIEMAIGADQGGSIRIPAAFSGCYGMKQTFGLVPYTGAMPIEATIDYLGPITSTVAGNALLLEVIAGEDGLDPRQYAPRTARYTDALGRGVEGLRIGIMREGFGLAVSDPAVDAKVRVAADRLARLGAQVFEINVPMHLDGTAIWTPIALEGLQMQMMHGNGMGFNWRGMYLSSLMEKHAGWRARADELSPSLKISMFVACLSG